MAKVSAKNAIIVAGGYLVCPDIKSYSLDYNVDPLEVTGFCETWRNYIPGVYNGQLSLEAYWNLDDDHSNEAFSTLSNKIVTLMPEGGTAGYRSFSIKSEQANFTPGGAVTDVLMGGNIVLQTSGAAGGPLPAWVLQHGNITNTATGTSVDDPTGGVVTAACAGILHVYTACAADTYAIKIMHSSDDTNWVDLVTFTLNGSAIGAEIVPVASGAINRYRKFVATRTGSAGNTLGFSVHFWRAG